MEQEFELPVLVDGREIEVKVILKPYGYSHRFSMALGDMELFFEPDEERHYRVIVPVESGHKLTAGEQRLIQSVAERLAAI